MSYKSLMAAAAGAAIVAATPAFAQGLGVGAGGPPASVGASAGVNAQGTVNASPNTAGHANDSLQPMKPSTPKANTPTPSVSTTTEPMTSTDTNVSAKSKAVINSQGPANASANGIAHANSNSVLARGEVASSTLPGLTTGLVVNNSGGTQIGTVTKVVTGPNSMVRAVVVTTADGKTYTLPASSLSISGSVITTTSTSIGG